MRTYAWAAAAAAAIASATPAQAQYRENQPQVLAPPPAPAPQLKIDAVSVLAPAYTRAGRPRVVLYWNNELTDQTAAPRADVTESRFDVRERRSGYSEKATTVHARGVPLQRTRSSAFTPRDAALLTQAFAAEFSRAGVNFVDRSLIIRSTAAHAHRSGGDPQLIESDALARHADLLLEVIQVPDPDAPLGYAFDIRVKSLKRAMQTASVYSLGQAPQETLPAEWIATARGYELQQVGQQPAADSPAEVGRIVAHDAMLGLAQALRAN